MGVWKKWLKLPKPPLKHCNPNLQYSGTGISQDYHDYCTGSAYGINIDDPVQFKHMIIYNIRFVLGGAAVVVSGRK
jgi:hypothetical protein